MNDLAKPRMNSLPPALPPTTLFCHITLLDLNIFAFYPNLFVSSSIKQDNKEGKKVEAQPEEFSGKIENQAIDHQTSSSISPPELKADAFNQRTDGRMRAYGCPTKINGAQ
jgi:hypothetical protein